MADRIKERGGTFRRKHSRVAEFQKQVRNHSVTSSRLSLAFDECHKSIGGVKSEQSIAPPASHNDVRPLFVPFVELLADVSVAELRSSAIHLIGRCQEELGYLANGGRRTAESDFGHLVKSFRCGLFLGVSVSFHFGIWVAAPNILETTAEIELHCANL